MRSSARRRSFDKTAALGSGRQEFLDDPGTAFVRDVEQVSVFGATVFPVRVDVSVLGEDDEESRAGIPVALHFDPLLELGRTVQVYGDLLDFGLGCEDEGLEAFGVGDLGGGYLAHGGFGVVDGGYWLAGRQGYPYRRDSCGLEK
jgi:hypothetical protein